MWMVAFALSTITVMYVGDAYADLAGVGESAFQKVAPSLTPVEISDGSLLSKDEVSVSSGGEKASGANSEKKDLFGRISTEEIEKCLKRGKYKCNGVEKPLSTNQIARLKAELAKRTLAFFVEVKRSNEVEKITFEVVGVNSQSRKFADEVNLLEMIKANINTNLAELADKTSERGMKKRVIAACEETTARLRDSLFFLSLLKMNNYNPAEKKFVLAFDCGTIGRLKLSFKDDKINSTTNIEAKTEETDGHWFSKSQIRNRYFGGLKEGDVFNYGKLRSALFNVNSQPDLTVETTISAENTNSQYYADVNLEINESIPLHGMFEINNYGMEEVEEWQASLTFQYLNLWKRDHVLTLSPSISFGGELFSFAGSYMAPHYWWLGGNTTLYGGYSRLDVDNIVPRLDLEGTGEFVGLQHSEYLWDDDKRLVALSAGVLWRYIEDRYTAYSRKLNSRDVSILPLSLALSYTRKKDDCLGGRNFATVQGVLNVMNSGDRLNEMWTDADKNYWILRWQTARLQPLPCPQLTWPWNWRIPDKYQWLLFMKLEGQYTTDTLIPVEKLSMGGYNCMRGYHARGYLGDYGVYGTVELRTPILVNLFSSTMFGTTNESKQWDRLQFLTFVDWGWTAFNDLPSSYDDNEFIYSAGIGARWSVTEYMQLKCDIAFPLRDTDWADDDDMEIYFSAQFQF